MYPLPACGMVTAPPLLDNTSCLAVPEDASAMEAMWKEGVSERVEMQESERQKQSKRAMVLEL